MTRYRNLNEEYRQLWKLELDEGDDYFRSPGLECAVRNSVGRIVKNERGNKFSPIEKTCELIESDETRDTPSTS